MINDLKYFIELWEASNIYIDDYKYLIKIMVIKIRGVRILFFLVKWFFKKKVKFKYRSIPKYI